MHTLIIGRTGSGKSALAKQLGSRLRQKGHVVFAYSPIYELGYTRRDQFGCAGAEFESRDPEEFENHLNEWLENNNKPIFLIVDEAHDFFTRGNCEYLWIATEGRHYGINLICCTQRGASIHPTIRSQCSHLYLFPCSLTDAKFMADEYGRRELLKAPSLAPGHYFKCTPVSLDRGRVF